MELSARKRAVLAAIIRTYIETGEPVGSKILTGLLENAPSSATLRNEMSELSELGLLTQPHTSAGRVPTSRAFRLYVNSLMKPTGIADSTRRYIDSCLSDDGRDMERMPRLAAETLSDLTGFPAFSCYTVDGDVTVKGVGMVPVAGHSGLLFLITSDGRARSRICRIPADFTSFSEQFEKIVRERIRRTPLYDMNKAKLQNVVAAAGLDALELMPLLTAVFEMAAEAAVSPVTVSGSAGLYRICGEDNARRILALAEMRDPFLKVLETAKGDSEVIFGSETGFSELRGTTIAVAKYSVGESCRGRIGIIGPSRMSYEQIIPSIEYTAGRLSRLMTDAGKDMED